MAQQSVPVPGEILKTTVIAGLTFEEIIVLAAAPLVLVFPSLMIRQIPLFVSIAVIILGAIGVVAVVFKTPKGQSPTEWFPAFIDRKIKPTRYQLKPKDNTKYGRPEVKYLNVIHTSGAIEAESKNPGFDAAERIESIEYADKLEKPDWLTTNNDGLLQRFTR